MCSRRALALAALVLGACGGESSRPNVLLVTVDTLRADGLGCYGYALDVSPTVDALAAEGVLFEDATAAWPKTRPSLAAILSGNWPRTTGIRHQEALRPLSDELVVLPEVFRDAGYQTFGVVANYNVGRTFGFEQGFDGFVESWQAKWREVYGDVPYENAPGRVKEYTDATVVTDEALRLFAARDRDRPFFLWVHYMDPHGPYVPPQSHRAHFEGDYAPAPRPLEDIPPYQRLEEDGRTVTDLARYRQRYDQEIRDFDDQLGRLRGSLEEAGVWDDLVVGFCADHGESFGEHDYVLEHGRYVWQASARVPFLLRAPGLAPGTRVATPISTVDLAPTLVELARLTPPETDGRSLIALLSGRAPATAVVTEAGAYRSKTQLAVRDGHWKLVWARSAEDRERMGGEWLLFDLRVDAMEERDVAAEHPDVTARLRERLEQWLDNPRSVPGSGETLDGAAVDSDMLRDLGYAGADEDVSATDRKNDE